jgi:hypothetical protein
MISLGCDIGFGPDHRIPKNKARSPLVEYITDYEEEGEEPTSVLPPIEQEEGEEPTSLLPPMEQEEREEPTSLLLPMEQQGRDETGQQDINHKTLSDQDESFVVSSSNVYDVPLTTSQPNLDNIAP